METSVDWVGERFWDDSSALHLLCTLFLFLLHQFHLRSSGIRFQRLGTPALRHSKLNRGLQNTINADFCLWWECKMVAPLKDSLAVFYKTKIILPYNLIITFLSTQRSWKLCPQKKNQPTDVYNSFIQFFFGLFYDFYNIVLVSAIQQREWATGIHILPISYASLSCPHPTLWGYHRAPDWASCV